MAGVRGNVSRSTADIKAVMFSARFLSIAENSLSQYVICTMHNKKPWGDIHTWAVFPLWRSKDLAEDKKHYVLFFIDRFRAIWIQDGFQRDILHWNSPLGFLSYP